MPPAVGLALLALAACSGPRATPSAPSRPLSYSFAALDGGEIELSRYRGKPVLLHIFTTWDTAATADADQLVELHKRRGQSLTIIGIALDPDGHRLVAPWRRALSVRYLIALSDEAVRAGRSPLGPLSRVPITILLDAKGRVLTRIERPLAPGEAEALVEGVEGVQGIADTSP